MVTKGEPITKSRSLNMNPFILLYPLGEHISINVFQHSYMGHDFEFNMVGLVNMTYSISKNMHTFHLFTLFCCGYVPNHFIVFCWHRLHTAKETTNLYLLVYTPNYYAPKRHH